MNLDNIYSNQDLSKYYNFLVLLSLKGNEKYSIDKAKLYLTDESDLNLMFEINKLYCGFTFNDNIYTIEPNGRGLVFTNDTLSQFIDKQRQRENEIEKIKSEDRILDNTLKTKTFQDISNNLRKFNINTLLIIIGFIITIGVAFIPSCIDKYNKDVKKSSESNTK